MERMLRNLLIIMLIMCINSCKSNSNNFTIDVDNFRVLIEDGAQLVDVRTYDEFEENRIGGALNIDVQKSGFIEKADSLLDKNKKVAVYCRSGRRSKKAVDLLRKAGYEAYDLDGGILEWKKTSTVL